MTTYEETDDPQAIEDMPPFVELAELYVLTKNIENAITRLGDSNDMTTVVIGAAEDLLSQTARLYKRVREIVVKETDPPDPL